MKAIKELLNQSTSQILKGIMPIAIGFNTSSRIVEDISLLSLIRSIPHTPDLLFGIRMVYNCFIGTNNISSKLSFRQFSIIVDGAVESTLLSPKVF